MFMDIQEWEFSIIYICTSIIPLIPKGKQLLLNILALSIHIHLGVGKELINIFSCHNLIVLDFFFVIWFSAYRAVLWIYMYFLFLRASIFHRLSI